MRKKSFSIPMSILAILLGCWVSTPQHKADQMRRFSVATFMPAWNFLHKFQKYLSDRPTHFGGKRDKLSDKHIAELELENVLLKSQIDKLSKWILSEEYISKQWTSFQSLEKSSKEAVRSEDRSFFERRAGTLISLIQSELIAIPSQVIYRTPSSWSSSLWINVGEAQNRLLNKSVISKNSPVVSGSALVGVIEYVGETQSRVRLITDAELAPAVRAVRGEGLEKQYLAKGELHGSSAPLWRSLHPILKGVGFNFEFPDKEGKTKPEGALLQRGDLLVTTGFDGVFPPDLPVGIVVQVTPPKSGGHLYELEALPAAHDIYDLETLFVLPPRGGE